MGGDRKIRFLIPITCPASCQNPLPVLHRLPGHASQEAGIRRWWRDCREEGQGIRPTWDSTWCPEDGSHGSLWPMAVSLIKLCIITHYVSNQMLIMLFLHPNQMPRSENVLEKDHSLDSFLTEKLETEEGLHHSCKQKHFDFPNSLTGERPWILPMDGYHFPGGAGCVWILVHSIYHFLNLVLAAYIQVLCQTGRCRKHRALPDSTFQPAPS